jgi:hypothetical protein
MLIMLVNAHRYNSVFVILPGVPCDLFRPPPTTDTNFKLYDSCMPYMQQKRYTLFLTYTHMED